MAAAAPAPFTIEDQAAAIVEVCKQQERRDQLHANETTLEEATRILNTKLRNDEINPRWGSIWPPTPISPQELADANARVSTFDNAIRVAIHAQAATCGAERQVQVAKLIANVRVDPSRCKYRVAQTLHRARAVHVFLSCVAVAEFDMRRVASATEMRYLAKSTFDQMPFRLSGGETVLPRRWVSCLTACSAMTENDLSHKFRVVVTLGHWATDGGYAAVWLDEITLSKNRSIDPFSASAVNCRRVVGRVPLQLHDTSGGRKCLHRDMPGSTLSLLLLATNKQPSPAIADNRLVSLGSLPCGTTLGGGFEFLGWTLSGHVILKDHERLRVENWRRGAVQRPVVPAATGLPPARQLLQNLFRVVTKLTIHGDIPVYALMRELYHSGGDPVPVVVVGGAVRDLLDATSESDLDRVNDIDLAVGCQWNQLERWLRDFFAARGHPLTDASLRCTGNSRDFGMMLLSKTEADEDGIDIGPLKAGRIDNALRQTISQKMNAAVAAAGANNTKQKELAAAQRTQKYYYGNSADFLNDACMRDYSINAIYADLFEWCVVDPFGGLQCRRRRLDGEPTPQQLKFIPCDARAEAEFKSDVGGRVRLFKALAKHAGGIPTFYINEPDALPICKELANEAVVVRRAAALLAQHSPQHQVFGGAVPLALGVPHRQNKVNVIYNGFADDPPYPQLYSALHTWSGEGSHADFGGITHAVNAWFKKVLTKLFKADADFPKRAREIRWAVTHRVPGQGQRPHARAYAVSWFNEVRTAIQEHFVDGMGLFPDLTRDAPDNLRLCRAMGAWAAVDEVTPEEVADISPVMQAQETYMTAAWPNGDYTNPTTRGLNELKDWRKLVLKVSTAFDPASSVGRGGGHGGRGGGAGGEGQGGEGGEDPGGGTASAAPVPSKNVHPPEKRPRKEKEEEK